MQLAPKIRYVSFLLRLQWTESDSYPAWIVSMQSTKTGELHWFPNLEAVIQFLRDEYGGYEVIGRSLSPSPVKAVEPSLPPDNEADSRPPEKPLA